MNKDASPESSSPRLSAAEIELEQVRALLSSATHLVSDLRQENLALKHALIAATGEARKIQEQSDTCEKQKNDKTAKRRQKRKDVKKHPHREAKKTLGECLRRARSDKRATVGPMNVSANRIDRDDEPIEGLGRLSSLLTTTLSNTDLIVEYGEDIPPPSREYLIHENRRAVEIIEGPLPSDSVTLFLEETESLLNHLHSKQTAVNYTAQGLHRLVNLYDQTGEEDLKRIALQALDEKKQTLAALVYFIANITAKRGQLLGLSPIPNPYLPLPNDIADPPLPPPVDDDQVCEVLECVLASLPTGSLDAMPTAIPAPLATS